MLNRIEPLRNELDSLEQEASENRLKNDEMQKLIAGLEASIAKYKEEYAILISQAQAIKSDLVNVESKVLCVSRNRQGCRGISGDIGDIFLSSPMVLGRAL